MYVCTFFSASWANSSASFTVRARGHSQNTGLCASSAGFTKSKCSMFVFNLGVSFIVFRWCYHTWHFHTHNYHFYIFVFNEFCHCAVGFALVNLNSFNSILRFSLWLMYLVLVSRQFGLLLVRVHQGHQFIVGPFLFKVGNMSNLSPWTWGSTETCKSNLDLLLCHHAVAFNHSTTAVTFLD